MSQTLIWNWIWWSSGLSFFFFFLIMKVSDWISARDHYQEALRNVSSLQSLGISIGNVHDKLMSVIFFFQKKNMLYNMYFKTHLAYQYIMFNWTHDTMTLMLDNIWHINTLSTIVKSYIQCQSSIFSSPDLHRLPIPTLSLLTAHYVKWHVG